jgi:hypothetical protein
MSSIKRKRLVQRAGGGKPTTIGRFPENHVGLHKHDGGGVEHHDNGSVTLHHKDRGRTHYRHIHRDDE